MSDDSSPAPDTIGDALRAVQAHFEGEDDPVFADLCDLVNRAAEEHARTPDRAPQLDMANAEIERLAAALRAEREAWQEASGADSPGELTAAVNAHRARRAHEAAGPKCNNCDDTGTCGACNAEPVDPPCALCSLGDCLCGERRGNCEP